MEMLALLGNFKQGFFAGPDLKRKTEFRKPDQVFSKLMHARTGCQSELRNEKFRIGSRGTARHLRMVYGPQDEVCGTPVVYSE